MQKMFFIDFDGTITKKDVVASMVEAFCREGWKEINDKWERGEISTEECAKQTFELFDATESDIYRLLDTVEFDDFFKPFVELCKKRGYEIFILSDGYDLMIDYLLKKYGLSDLTFYANKLIINNNRYSIKCPNINPDCGKCGTCKKGLLNYLKKEGFQTVYIGDGYSDICVSSAADILFAKDSLLQYCNNNNIPAVPFENFNDIIIWIENEFSP
ncbi:MAG: 2-hydroxy-3-keto-5-methylthiopentenyl-phosphate phosphatase [Thermosediminibacterales bacterium]|nr:2-hydroxy-3-keto-5-methylthiopentenyl-phosphate phosphatase [Thermosediminibacterales bacterium]MDK2835925.1 2-hydroxy-3-keto-5-methylthiopentenyl-phosphate phosphatase [Thermosediminibacterales bacterium]